MDDLLGEQDLLGMPAGGIEVRHPIELILHRVGECRIPVAEDAGPETRHVVEVLVAVDVPEVSALPVCQPDGPEKLVARQVAVRAGHQLERASPQLL